MRIRAAIRHTVGVGAVLALTAFTAGGVAFGAAPSASAPPTGCGGPGTLRVPGAQLQISACLADLTTAATVNTGHSIAAEWAGLQPAGAINPTGIPGIQLDG